MTNKREMFGTTYVVNDSLLYDMILSQCFCRRRSCGRRGESEKDWHGTAANHTVSKPEIKVTIRQYATK